MGGIAGSVLQSPSVVGALEGSNPHTLLDDEPSGSSPLPLSSSDDNISVSSSSGPAYCFLVPESWPPSIMNCVALKCDEERKRALVPSVRNEIVRIIATNMFCHDPNPKKALCTTAAKLLVKKYAFMKDIGDHVSGYVSFKNNT